MKKIFLLLLIFLLLTATAVRAVEEMEYYSLGLNSSLAYKKIEYFTKALQVNPDLTEAYESRALEYFFQRRFDKAIQDYNRVIASKPSDANALLMRVRLISKEKKAEDTRQNLRIWPLITRSAAGSKPLKCWTGRLMILIALSS